MRITHKVVGILWMAICAYFVGTRVQGISEVHPHRFETLAINLFFILLYYGGAFVSFYVLTGARWARIALAVIALLTVSASLVGLFAYFNSLPFSAIGLGVLSSGAGKGLR